VDVRYWPKADMRKCSARVRYCGWPTAAQANSCDNLSVGPMSNFNKHKINSALTRNA